MSRTPTRFLPALCLVLALSACDRGAAPEAPAGAPDAVAGGEAAPDGPAAAESFERTWLGVLPCADCDGIQTRLQLVRDGGAQTYELEETYLGAEGDAVFTQRGTWVQEGDGASAGLFRLDPDAPTGRRFELRPDGALDLLDGEGRPLDAGGQYTLQRL
jgi:copper homeostasis protein (lipoprotein)